MSQQFSWRRLVAILPAALTVFLASLPVLTASASADATIEGPPKFSAAPGLPDGRFYEQVSPGDKNGNQAGATTSLVDSGAVNHYGVASSDGNAVLFEGTGPMGESPSGDSDWFVATKKAGEPGWSTRSLLPAEYPGAIQQHAVNQLDPSSDLSHAMIETQFLLESPGCPDFYLTGPDPFVAAEWLGRTELEHPVLLRDRPGWWYA